MKDLFRRFIQNVSTRSLLKQCQARWETLAKQDAKYHIWSTEYNQPEEDFRLSGQNDFNALITTDTVLKQQFSDFSFVNMLEIGCGVGRMSEFFADNFKTLCAIDISPEMISLAKKRLQDKSNICFTVTDGKSVPFTSNSLDFAFSFIVFQHIPSYDIIESLFLETKRVLKSGGMFKVQLRGKPLQDQAKTKWYYGVHYSLNEAYALAAKTGFEIMKYEGVDERYFWLWLKKSDEHQL